MKAFSALLCCLILFIPLSVSANWSTTDIDGNVNSGFTSMKLDSSENAHIVYAQQSGVDNYIRHAYYNGSTWIKETVGMGSYPTIAIDSSDYPHLAYSFWTGSDTTLFYAYKDGSGWHIESVLTGLSGFPMPVIAIAQSGTAHICYSDGANLIHLWQNGSGWSSEVASAESYMESRIAFVLDSQNYGHAVYVATIGVHSMTYAYQDSGGWHTEFPDNWTSLEYSICMDTNDYPHIGFSDEATNSMTYSYKDGSGWHTELVEAVSGNYPSIALDQNGYPRISFCSGNGLETGYKDAYGWNLEVVDPMYVSGSQIAVNQSSESRFSYVNSMQSMVKYSESSPPLVPALNFSGVILLLLGLSCIFIFFKKC